MEVAMQPNPTHKSQGQWLLQRTKEVYEGDGDVQIVFGCAHATDVHFESSPKSFGTINHRQSGYQVSLGTDSTSIMPDDQMIVVAKLIERVLADGIEAVDLHTSDLDPMFVGQAITTALLSPKEWESSTRSLGRVGIELNMQQQAAFNKGIALGRASNVGRWLMARPYNQCNNDAFAELVRATFQGLDGVSVTEPTREQYARMGLANAVAQASAHPPYVITVQIDPLSGPTKRRRGWALKGVTFDTGGENHKGDGALDMKGDKGAACMGFGAARYLADHRQLLTQTVVFVFAIVDNMLGPSGIKQRDIVPAYALHPEGRPFQVEIIDTDAEGRLLLADALAYAQDVAHKAGSEMDLIGAGTLTGHARKTVDTDYSVLHVRNSRRREDLVSMLKRIATACGDPLCELSESRVARKALTSHCADLANLAPDHTVAGSQNAAEFLFALSSATQLMIDMGCKTGKFDGGNGHPAGLPLPALTWLIIAIEEANVDLAASDPLPTPS